MHNHNVLIVYLLVPKRGRAMGICDCMRRDCHGRERSALGRRLLIGKRREEGATLYGDHYARGVYVLFVEMQHRRSLRLPQNRIGSIFAWIHTPKIVVSSFAMLWLILSWMLICLKTNVHIYLRLTNYECVAL